MPIIMSTNTTSSNSVTSVRETVPSAYDLVRGDVPQLLAWMAGKHCTAGKLYNVLLLAAVAGLTDIFLAIIDSGRVSIGHLAETFRLACSCNRLTIAKIVVERYRSLLKFQHFYNALLNACSEGHSEVVQWLLGEMKLSHDDSVTWLLATASARGDINTVKLLTAQTASQAIHDTSHALRCACYNGRCDVVEWLMTHTACSVSKLGDLGTVSGGTMTSLAAACHHGHADVVRILLQCVTPHTVNLQCGKYNNSALHSVIWRGRNSGENMLHLACVNNDIETVNILLYTNDVNIQNNVGSTPLHQACQCGNIDIVQSLISVFAQTNVIDDDKRTPVVLAKRYANTELVSCFSQCFWCADTTTDVTTSVSVTQSTSGIASITDVTKSADTATDVTTSVSVTQSTSGIASITDVTVSDVTISDVHSRQQHDRKRVSEHNTVKQRHNTYV